MDNEFNKDYIGDAWVSEDNVADERHQLMMFTGSINDLQRAAKYSFCIYLCHFYNNPYYLKNGITWKRLRSQAKTVNTIFFKLRRKGDCSCTTL